MDREEYILTYRQIQRKKMSYLHIIQLIIKLIDA
jgi:hypothetical protein